MKKTNCDMYHNKVRETVLYEKVKVKTRQILVKAFQLLKDA